MRFTMVFVVISDIWALLFMSFLGSEEASGLLGKLLAATIWCLECSVAGVVRSDAQDFADVAPYGPSLLKTSHHTTFCWLRTAYAHCVVCVCIGSV